MSAITLHFANPNSPELQRSQFECSQDRSLRISVRGKTEGAISNAGTFQWTPAVKALSVLLLRTAADARKPKEEQKLIMLEGMRGSLASSLDYSIRKQPNWLAEMFGCDSSGNSLARKIFKRSNSEFRRVGPVTVSLNERLLKGPEIVIFIDQNICSSSNALNVLADLIESQWRPLRKKREYSIEKPKAKWKDFLHNIHRSDILSSLNSTDIFHRSILDNTLTRIYQNPSYTSLAGKSTPIVGESDYGLSNAERYGISNNSLEVKQELSPQDPIQCAIPCTLPAATAIFLYLKQVKGYNLELNTRFTHAVEIVKRISSGQFENIPDICLLGIAPAATLLSQKNCSYDPLMLMPNINQRVLARKAKETEAEINQGEYLVMHEDPTTASFYFDQLLREGKVSTKQVAVKSTEPDETFKALSEGNPDLRAILFFPFHEINREYNYCEFLADNSSHRSEETVLFVNKEFAAKSKRLRFLNIAIRDAWLQLRNGGEVLDFVLTELCADRDHINFLERCSGLELNRPIAAS